MLTCFGLSSNILPGALKYTMTVKFHFSRETSSGTSSFSLSEEKYCCAVEYAKQDKVDQLVNKFGLRYSKKGYSSLKNYQLRNSRPGRETGART